MNLNMYNFDGIVVVLTVPNNNTILQEGDVIGFFLVGDIARFYGVGTELLFECSKYDIEKYFDLMTISEEQDEGNEDFLLGVIARQIIASENEIDHFVDYVVNSEASIDVVEVTPTKVAKPENSEIEGFSNLEDEWNIKLLNDAIDKAIDAGDKNLFNHLVRILNNIK